MTSVFETFDRTALAALKARDITRVRAADYFTKIDEADAETDNELARWDQYLSQFAKLHEGRCLCCGNSLRCYLGMGIFGGFEWGMQHGEGRCTYCHYPMRGHHRVEGLGTIRNLFLPYHPSQIAFPPEATKEDGRCPRSP